MQSGISIEKNLQSCERLTAKARELGAELVVTPECTLIMVQDKRKIFKALQDFSLSKIIGRLGQIAACHGVHLLIGSVPYQNLEGDLFNRSLLFSPDGKLISYYDKIHLFDVELQNGEVYRESDVYTPGNQAVMFRSPVANIGFSICYDVRFPNLYRVLAQAGAQIITVPAAFTELTGKAHWKTLLRSRAIETGCYVIGPAQSGMHEDGRATYGNSLIVDPWGKVLSESNIVGEDVMVTLLNFHYCDTIHSMLPAWSLNRQFSRPD